MGRKVKLTVDIDSEACLEITILVSTAINSYFVSVTDIVGKENISDVFHRITHSLKGILPNAAVRHGQLETFPSDNPENN